MVRACQQNGGATLGSDDVLSVIVFCADDTSMRIPNTGNRLDTLVECVHALLMRDTERNYIGASILGQGNRELWSMFRGVNDEISLSGN